MNFLSGNLFKTISSYVYDEQGYWKNKSINNNIFFIKTDWIDDFINNHIPNYPYKIITHNSDYAVTEKYIPHLNTSNLLHWFASEVDIDHEKLMHIPTGLANERIIYKEGQLEHFHFGSRKLFSTILEEDRKKTKTMAVVSFDINTNHTRLKCVEACNKLGYKNIRIPFELYLNDIKDSMFCIAPTGSRPESHRIWECLYLKCIPVVLPNKRFSHYKKFPVILIDKWEDILSISFDETLYNKYMNNFNINNLDGSYVLNEIINL